ncbi:MAG TPA: hypothetical protein VG711_12560 [Phycisphaerales bacterium]|nr:hypothetical protein [Phycisphaerales bacterium]
MRYSMRRTRIAFQAMVVGILLAISGVVVYAINPASQVMSTISASAAASGLFTGVTAWVVNRVDDRRG